MSAIESRRCSAASPVKITNVTTTARLQTQAIAGSRIVIAYPRLNTVISFKEIHGVRKADNARYRSINDFKSRERRPGADLRGYLTTGPAAEPSAVAA
jgi:hypothetical protein